MTCLGRAARHCWTGRRCLARTGRGCTHCAGSWRGLDFEIEVFTRFCHTRLYCDRGYVALQQIPGIGAVLAAVFCAEIGDMHRFPGPAQLACWAWLTPQYRESDTHVHRGQDHQQSCSGCREGVAGAHRPLPPHPRLVIEQRKDFDAAGAALAGC